MYFKNRFVILFWVVGGKNVSRDFACIYEINDAFQIVLPRVYLWWWEGPVELLVNYEMSGLSGQGPQKDLECPSSKRLEALVLSHDSRAMTRSPSPRAQRPDFPGTAREAP